VKTKSVEAAPAIYQPGKRDGQTLGSKHPHLIDLTWLQPVAIPSRKEWL